MKFRYSINSKWDKTEIIEVMEALEFAANYYGLTKGVTTVKLICTDLDSDDGTADKIKAGRFEIRVNKTNLSINEIVRTIFHEMTHIKQYAVDGLKLAGRQTTYKGKSYPGADYWLSPWEMEARAMEEPLFIQFREEF